MNNTTVATERASSVHSTRSLSSPRNKNEPMGHVAVRSRASTSSVRSTGRADIVSKAKEVIAAANGKIQRLTDRCSEYDTLNTELQQQMTDLSATEQRRTDLNTKYKREIDEQRQTIIGYKQQEEALSSQLQSLQNSIREQSALYNNNLLSMNMVLYKVAGDQISRFKYNKLQRKRVVFTSRINHLFYCDDEQGGSKLLMVNNVFTSHSDIDEAASLGLAADRNSSWFVVQGKKRAAMFITPNAKIRDNWVEFIQSSLNLYANNGEDEFSMLTSLLEDSVSHTINNELLPHDEDDDDDDNDNNESDAALLSTEEEEKVDSPTGNDDSNGFKRALGSLRSLGKRHNSGKNKHGKNNSLSLILGRSNSNTAKNATAMHMRQSSGSFSLSTKNNNRVLSAAAAATGAQSVTPTGDDASETSVFTNSTTMNGAEEEETGPVHVVVTYEIKEDKLEAFMKAITPIIISTNKDPACLRYNIHQDRRQKCKLVMIEKWATQQALTNHLKQPHLKAYRHKIMKLGVHEVLPNVSLCRPLV